jgi:hypothetical protein
MTAQVAVAPEAASVGAEAAPDDEAGLHGEDRMPKAFRLVRNIA